MPAIQNDPEANIVIEAHVINPDKGLSWKKRVVLSGFPAGEAWMNEPQIKRSEHQKHCPEAKPARIADNRGELF